jgi:hypothetical protein
MRIAYLTVDEVNEDLALRLAEEYGMAVFPHTFRDPPPDGQVDAVLYDWDSFPRSEQREILARLLEGPLSCPVGVHGYNVPEPQVEALRKKTVVVFRALQPEVFRLLHLAADQMRTARHSGHVARNCQGMEEEQAQPENEPERGGDNPSPRRAGQGR